ncbi:luxR family transcriptional regulator domain protein [Mycobacterium xenopi 3993]|nr:luxR family transcriptional regulator domain protein [Mycobacterium xenopi 3993]
MSEMCGRNGLWVSELDTGTTTMSSSPMPVRMSSTETTTAGGACRVRRAGGAEGDEPKLAALRVRQGRRRPWRRSGVACRFLDQLYARCDSEFGVDVGEVGLHSAR